MKITNGLEFKKAINKAAFPGYGISNCYYQCIRIQVLDNKVTIMGTNFDDCVEVKLDCQSNDNWTRIVDKKVLKNFIKGVKKGNEITLTPGEDNLLTIEYQGCVLEAIGADEKEWPNFLEINAESIHCPGLPEAIKDVLPATTKDYEKFAIPGILIKDHKIVGVDGKRLIERWITTTLPEAIMSIGRGLYIASKFNDADIKIGTKYASIKDGNTTVRVRLIAEKFPNYEKSIIDTEGYHQVIFTQDNKTALINTLKNLPVNKRTKAVRFTMGEKLELDSTGTDIGHGKATLPIPSVSGEMTVTLNRDFVIDALKTNVTSMFVKDGAVPVILIGGKVIAAIMPLRVG